jgi:hypothetical protein
VPRFWYSPLSRCVYASRPDHWPARAAMVAVPRGAVVLLAVTELQSGSEGLVRAQHVGRVLGRERHDAADGVRAVERGCRTADDVHALEQVDVDAVTGGVREAADCKRFGQAHTVHLEQYAIALDAADVEVRQAEAALGVAHRHARLVADQVLDVGDELAIDALGVDDGDGGRSLAQRARRLGRGDGHLLELRLRHIGGDGSRNGRQ